MTHDSHNSDGAWLIIKQCVKLCVSHEYEQTNSDQQWFIAYKILRDMNLLALRILAPPMMGIRTNPPGMTPPGSLSQLAIRAV